MQREERIEHDHTAKTKDELGFDLEDTRSGSATVTLGRSAPEVKIPTRQHDGHPAPELPAKDRLAALEKLGIATDEQALAASRHVRLDMRRTYVSGRGHVNLIRTWHVWSEVPRADWISWLDVASYGGIVELWFRGLTANRQYFFDIAVNGWRRNASSAFKVGSSAGFYANFSASPPIRCSTCTGYCGRPVTWHLFGSNRSRWRR